MTKTIRWYNINESLTDIWAKDLFMNYYYLCQKHSQHPMTQFLGVNCRPSPLWNDGIFLLFYLPSCMLSLLL